MRTHIDSVEAATRSQELVDQIKPILAGQEAAIQSAILADLLAIWLAGHAPQMRDEILVAHIALVRELIGPNERIMFGDEGHPEAELS
jgi:hypothetical protein